MLSGVFSVFSCFPGAKSKDEATVFEEAPFSGREEEEEDDNEEEEEDEGDDEVGDEVTLSNVGLSSGRRSGDPNVGRGKRKI